MSQEILEQLAIVKAQNEILIRQVKALNEIVTASVHEQVLSAQDVMTRWGLSKTQFYTKPWVQPNFGQSDFAAGSKRWKLSTVIDWESQPEEVHRAQWNTMTVAQRKKLAGVA